MRHSTFGRLSLQSGSRGNPLKLNYTFITKSVVNMHMMNTRAISGIQKNFSWGRLAARGLICPVRTISDVQQLLYQISISSYQSSALSIFVQVEQLIINPNK